MWTSRAAQNADLARLNTFLNPSPAPGMSQSQYQSMRAQRARDWANFVKNNG